MTKLQNLTHKILVSKDKLLKKSQASFAAAAIFAIMWAISIYGLTSMAMVRK